MPPASPWVKGACVWVRRPEEGRGQILVLRRKLGTAVARNRVKRRLRHILRELPAPTAGLVVLAQPAALAARFAALRQELRALVARLGAP
jgi:ribonuclease P protein component